MLPFLGFTRALHSLSPAVTISTSQEKIRNGSSEGVGVGNGEVDILTVANTRPQTP